MRGSPVEPIRWKGDRLELLDQRLLPDQTVYVTCRSATEVAQAIRDMVVRGAPAIGCAAAFGIALSKGSPYSYEILAKSRPTAVNLFWALDRMRKAKDLEAEAQAMFAEDLAANRELFAGRLEQSGVDLLGSVTQIVPVLTGDPDPTMAAAGRLLEGGVLLQGIRPPTVPPGPDNPLGRHMMRLGWPSYLIHGTNKPSGAGTRQPSGSPRTSRAGSNAPIVLSVE